MSQYIRVKSKYIEHTKVIGHIKKIQLSMSQSVNKYKGHKLDPRHKRLTILDLINIMARGIRIRRVRDMMRRLRIKATGTSLTTSASATGRSTGTSRRERRS